MLKPKYILIMIAMLPQLSQAFSWQDLWLNKDQQGAALLKQSKNSQAAEKFNDSNWKGSAYYKDKQYEKAYNEFKRDNSATGLYNQANSLANMQKYQEAVDAYTQAQKLEKDYPDAQHNKEIVEKLLEQQKQSKDSKPDQNKKDKDKQKQDQSKQDKSSDKQQNSENKKQDGSQQQQEQQQKSEDKSKQQAQNDAQKKQGQNKDSQGAKEDNKPAQQDKQQEAANSLDAAEKEKKAKEEAQAQAAKTGQKPEGKTDKSATAQMTPQQSYEQQQIKAELAKIPDDPGGLLRNKFIRDYEKQKQEVNNNE